MYEVLEVVWIDGLWGIGRAADVDCGLLDVESPAMSNDFTVGIDTVLAAEASIGVVLARLDELVLRGDQVVGDLIDDDIKSFRIGQTIVGEQARVWSAAGLRLFVCQISGGERGIVGLDARREGASACLRRTVETGRKAV